MRGPACPWDILRRLGLLDGRSEGRLDQVLHGRRVGGIADAGESRRYRIRVDALLEEPSGRLRLRAPGSEARTDARGRYRVAVPVAPAYEATAHLLRTEGQGFEDAPLRATWRAANAGDEVHDFPPAER